MSEWRMTDDKLETLIAKYAALIRQDGDQWSWMWADLVSLRDRMAQQAQPLTDAMIYEASTQRRPSTSLIHVERDAFREGAKWARDRMAQQAQPRCEHDETEEHDKAKS
jgi:hypothetical protein